MKKTEELIKEVARDVVLLLLEKNKAYGDTAHYEVERQKITFVGHAKLVEAALQRTLEGDTVIAYLEEDENGETTANRVDAEGNVINLALNGLQLNGQYHLLSRYLDGGNDPEFVLLELSRVDVERERWISGPFWRDWATWPEFLSSRSYSFEPSLAIPFAANRALTSFSYRRALDNWVFACVRSGGLDTSYRDRNRQITSDMDRHLGFSPGSFDRSMTEADIPPGESRPWRQTRAGAIWLEHILDLCDRHGIEVWILQPPVPPFVAQERRRDGFRAGFVALVADLRQRYPRLGLEVLEPTGYELADFADHRHFSPQGSRKLCRDLVPWVDSLTVH